MSLFSGLNNLKDITLDPRYAAICGYTETDLDTVFTPELPGLDRERIRDWYNGYNWRGSERVYNPFDILLLFDTREFAPHWFETATPTFLIDTLFRRRISSLALDGMLTSSELLSSFDVGAIATEALLFQTGYLTIKDVRDRVFYSYFAATGLDVTVEDSRSRGRADMAVRFGGNVYLFEFKVVEQANEGAALAQLRARGYADKYRASGEPIHLVGVSSARRRAT